MTTHTELALAAGFAPTHMGATSPAAPLARPFLGPSPKTRHGWVPRRLGSHRTPAFAGRRLLPADDPTSALLARLAEGDRGVASELFRALWPAVRRLAGGMLLHDADADDAAQDAMLTIFARVGAYDRTRAGTPWALAIAFHACRTVRKKRHRRREDPAPATSDVVTEATADEELAHHQLLAAAVAALDDLSETDRETLLATYWEEHEAPVAGATLRKRRERALDRLRTLFRQLYGFG